MRARLTGRTRRLAIALLASAGLVATASTAWAGPPPAPSSAQGGSGHGGPGHGGPGHGKGGGTYLALGDSVPFGYRGNESPAVYSDPGNFTGYPELVAHRLNLSLLNASCPGETTDSFIDSTAQSNGCENSLTSEQGYRDSYPLHVDYGKESQLDYAVETLQKTPDVHLVTLMVGANDTFLCSKTTLDKCTSPAEIQGVAQNVQKNLNVILSRLRNEGGYDGQIVVVTYYALNYTDPATAGTLILDDAMTLAALANGGTVASGFFAFLPAAVKAGGSSIDAGLVLPEDVHPTDFGQHLLAKAVVQVVRSARHW